MLFTAAESLRTVALILSPIMPNRTQTVLDIFNVNDYNIQWGGLTVGEKIKEHKPLFPRIETS